MKNPCLYMEALGYKYEYKEGAINNCEDVIIYYGEKINIVFNLVSKLVVVTMHKDNAEYYGGHPVVFLDNVTMECINYIRERLGWCDHSYFDENKD